MPKITIDIPDQCYTALPVPKLIERRNAFLQDHPVEPCTCDSCLDVTRCALAYDDYNTAGDCLLSK